MMIESSIPEKLFSLKNRLNDREKQIFSAGATLSRDGVRRIPEERQGHRQSFSVDADRILHSRAYTRYIDKTQVFSLVENDHITHRVLHVQLVSKIARTVGRFLGLNEDLIEAIALGHDIGHPPFGHDGEQVLAKLCRENGLPGFQHNLQSIVFLESIEKKGQGLNLTLQVLDGIMCHDGEVHNKELCPATGRTFEDFDREFEAKLNNPDKELVPMTLEGCLMRFCDTVSYIGRDIEDAIELKLINREDIPSDCRAVLGSTNGQIVYTLVTDLISSSVDSNCIRFSGRVSDSLKQLKEFNYKHIYLNPVIKRNSARIEACYRTMFEGYLEILQKGRQDNEIFVEYVNSLSQQYRQRTKPAAVVRDFIAGMTDEYFIKRAAAFGCEVPGKS